MEENQKKAFDFAADLTKQLITLSTAIVTLTVTFSKDIIGGIDDSIRILLLISWVAFIISIILGILTLMALTGNLDPMSKTQTKDRVKDTDTEVPENKPILTINSKNVRGTSQWQVYTFLIALIFTCSYGYKATKGPKKEDQHKDSYMIIRETKLGIDTTTTYIDTLWIEKQK